MCKGNQGGTRSNTSSTTTISEVMFFCQALSCRIRFSAVQPSSEFPHCPKCHHNAEVVVACNWLTSLASTGSVVAHCSCTLCSGLDTESSIQGLVSSIAMVESEGEDSEGGLDDFMVDRLLKLGNKKSKRAAQHEVEDIPLTKRAKTNNKNTKKNRFTAEEDERLRVAVLTATASHEAASGISWSALALTMPGRDNTQCRQRWAKIQHPKKVKGKWTDAEDAKLLALVIEHGCAGSNSEAAKVSWRTISGRINRSVQQCRYRWKMHLSPEVNKFPFTEDETRTMIKLAGEEGFDHDWAGVCKQLQRGRTSVMVKNFYARKQRAISRPNSKWERQL